MKRVLLVMLAGCFMLAACKKETEIEHDQLHNTVWQSGQYNENSGGAIAYGAIYYNDGDACRELLKFSYGFVDRYYTYHGEEIKYLPENCFSGCTSLTTIFVSNLWNFTHVSSLYGFSVFSDCTSLVGGNGTAYNSSYTESNYARIDGKNGLPGCLTLKA